jgi:hypothetical protein
MPDWNKRFGDATDQLVLGVQINQNGGVFFAGSFLGGVAVGGQTVTTGGLPAGKASGYIAGILADGTQGWIKKHDDTHAGVINSLALSGAGDVFAAGSTITDASTKSAFLQKLPQSGGTPVKSQSWDALGSPLFNGVDIAYSPTSVNGNFAAIAGEYFGNGTDPCTFSDMPKLNAATPISVVLKLEPTTLACQASLILPAPTAKDNNKPTSIAINGLSEVVVAGTYEGSMGKLCDVKPTQVNSTASYVLKTEPNLAVSWHKEFVPKFGDIKIVDVAVSSDNSQIFVTGSLLGSIDPGNGTTYLGVVGDLFVMALNASDGHVQWFSLVKGDGFATGQSIVEFNNDIYVAGITDGEMSVQVYSPIQGEAAGSICSSTKRCPFLMKFERMCGNAVWAMQLGAATTPATAPAESRLAASARGLLLGLTWDADFILGTGSLISSSIGGTDIVLAKFFTPKP